nr:hypothetical protein [Tanacetum cinerariifolium]
MALTFANTHNLITYLTKSDASEGFEQILNFLNASVIQYALTINPTIYVSCIKQFWSSVSIKKTNDVVRLQALIDRRKVIITKDTVRQVLHLDNAKIIDCLPNEEIFAELVRMGAQVGDLSSHTTKYTSPALTQKVFANIRRVGKGFSRVDTPLFKGMLVPQQVADDVAADDIADVATDDVTVVVAEDVALTLPPSLIAQPSSPTPQQQPSQPSHDAAISTDLLNTLFETWGIIAKIDADKDVILEEVDAEKDAEVAKKDVAVQGRKEKSQTKVYHIDLEHAYKLLSMQDDEPEPAELREVIKVVTTTKQMIEVVTATATTITAAPSAARRRKGVVIRDPEETATSSTIVHFEPKSKDKGKGILVQEPKPLKKQAHIEQDEAYARELEAELNKSINWDDDLIEQVKRKEKQDNAVLIYQALKRKPQIKAQARKNMMVYLKNMVGFKMDFFKGMSYDDIRPIFEKHFNSIVGFLDKGESSWKNRQARHLKEKVKVLSSKHPKSKV